MKEPVCCMPEGLLPFSSLPTDVLIWCSTPKGSWTPEPDDLPDYQLIYCAIAARYVEERER